MANAILTLSLDISSLLNSVICLPFKTPSYSEGAVAGEEQGIAKCTLRNFPSLDIHWSALSETAMSNKGTSLALTGASG